MNSLISIYGDLYQIVGEHHYTENRAQTVLEIFDSETGEPGGVITVCIPGVTLEFDETILKPLSGFDIVETLENAGIAKRTERIVRSGYSHYPVVKLTPKFLSQCTITNH